MSVENDSYDYRQYQVMRSRLEKFMDGRISLNSLATDLEALRDLLQNPAPEWITKFQAEWEVLEEINGVVLDRWEGKSSSKHFTELEQQLLANALKSIQGLLAQTPLNK